MTWERESTEPLVGMSLGLNEQNDKWGDKAHAVQYVNNNNNTAICNMKIILLGPPRPRQRFLS
jgi:hypothetical protein